jgi:hypothetical protein
MRPSPCPPTVKAPEGKILVPGSLGEPLACLDGVQAHAALTATPYIDQPKPGVHHQTPPLQPRTPGPAIGPSYPTLLAVEHMKLSAVQMQWRDQQ